MSTTSKKNAKVERKKTMTRVVCLAICVVMVGSVLLAALLSQTF